MPGADVHARLALLEHPACALHAPGPGHSDDPRRLRALEEALRADAPLGARLLRRRATAASEEDLLRVHSAGHVAAVRDAAARARREGAPVWLDPDTALSGASWEAALASAGCACAAAEAVLEDGLPGAFALSRPPGHHASRDRAMGFCLFNNVAVAIRRLQARGRLGRALVVDWDAHHANGTQEIFYEDPGVYVLSVHLSPHYPGTGGAGERGAGEGLGTTRNVELPAGAGAGEYRARFVEALDEALATFTPDAVFLSAGLDCLEGDPEGGLRLRPADLHALAADLVAHLPAATRGRIVGVLEGGYALANIGAGLVNLLRGLTGLPPAPP